MYTGNVINPPAFLYASIVITFPGASATGTLAVITFPGALATSTLALYH